MLRLRAQALVDGFEREIATINRELEYLVSGIALPKPPPIPGPIIDMARHPAPLISSAWGWIEQTDALRARKAYEGR